MSGEMSKKMKCPQCGEYVWDEQEFCDVCGEELDWSQYVEEPEIPSVKGLHYGEIVCDCGKSFYFESVSLNVSCVACGRNHITSTFPVKGDENGTNI